MMMIGYSSTYVVTENITHTAYPENACVSACVSASMYAIY